MTQNLRIQNTTISNLDSDMENGSFSIPSSSLANWQSELTHHDKSNVFVNEHGGFYTWYLATVGEGTNANIQKGITAKYSICPKNWKLPTKDEAEGLISKYTFQSIQQSPALFGFTGRVTGGSYDNSISASNGYGWYLTSTARANSCNTQSGYYYCYVYLIIVMNGWNNEYNRLDVGTHTPAGTGNPIRCISR